MSLKIVFSKEKTQSILDVMPDEMIVWKVVTAPTVDQKYKPSTRDVWLSAFGRGDSYFDDGMFDEYKPHANLCVESVRICAGKGTYISGFHSFVSRASCHWMRASCSRQAHTNGWKYVTAKVLKEWIAALGVEEENNIVIVSSQIIMPTYPNTDITKELGEVESPAVELIEELALVKT